MGRRRTRKRLEAMYGQIPDPHYFHGDMAYIRTYSDFRREQKMDSFWIDDITWNDLDLDEVFLRINPGLSSSGEQFLYHMLRTPAVTAEEYEFRRSLIDLMGREPELRLRTQLILARMGCIRRADLCRAFSPAAHGAGMLLVYLALLLGLAAAAISLACGWAYGLQALFLMLVVNSLTHELARRRVQSDLDTVNYTVSMVFALHRLRRLRSPLLDVHLSPAYRDLDRLRAVLRTGGVSTARDDTMADVIATFTLVDLIAYEFLKNKLSRCHREIFSVHEHLGRLDAAIAVASYRQSVAFYTEPELTFGPADVPAVRAAGLVHPLLTDPVPNDLITDRSLLITGSNASGKSTYLKTAALAALMAQSLCTVLAESYRADAFYIYSSMAISDDLLAGESYYIAETRSLKRILDSAAACSPIFCVVDEVLRGTNTVERIAASSEVLRSMTGGDILCLAATHDVELCALLEDRYRLFHFEEQVDEREMVFDYLLRQGPATSRNAINLLRLMGFDEGIVRRAHESANHYLATGTWQDLTPS
ncbi:MAG: hypothetical protein E7426_04080 [Ruminococcaceae bacterium]|nr:hypothetical protein [Oscillospiraceae bacterium]